MGRALEFNKLPYVTLWAVKFEAVVQLYRDVLKLPVVQQNSSFIMLGTQGARLAFHKLDQAPPLMRHTVELHLEVEDVDKAYEALKAKGIQFEQQPVNRPWGSRQASFRDPEGYTVELVGPLKEGEPAQGY